MRNAGQRCRMLALSLIAVVAGIALAASLAAGRAGAQRKYPSYPRAQSLITSGTRWGNFAGLNPYFGSYDTGTVGLCNETLLRYDPLKDKYINWLASSAQFTGLKQYTVKVRSGVKWSNGDTLTGDDVAWNYKLGRFKTAFWNTLWKNIAGVSVSGNTVKFNFKKTPNYAQWANLVWNLPIINPKQGASINETTLTTYSPANPIGTGPYELDVAGYDPTTRVVWKKKAVWWAAQQKLAPSPKPQYVIDRTNTSPNVHVLPGTLLPLDDLNNDYLPGVQQYVKSHQMQTYFPEKPYHLSANTAWLEVNTTKPALNDRAFRKALATSINVDNIVKYDYGHLVLPANATGLLPTWKKWIDQKQVKQLGFTYSKKRAKAMLKAAGYKDKNGDGYVETPTGKKINLKIAVPQGWSDWESARDMIIASAKAAGINMHKDEGDFNHWQSERNSGTFDLVMDNNYQISDNPWTYYDGIFRLPVSKEQTAANFGRYKNATAWKLSKQLDKTRPKDVRKRKAIMKKLQKIMLTEVPIIPLWYNGLWSQSQSKYWTHWPSSTSKRNYTPSMWRGYLQMTGIDMITHLEPANG